MAAIKFAKIINGEVVGNIMVDPSNLPEWIAEEGYVVADGLEVGMVSDGAGVFSAPSVAAIIPEVSDYVLEAYQFHAMIGEIGKYQDILAAINAIPDPKARRIAMNKLERGAKFHRNDPLMLSLSSQLGLTAGAVDALWLEAKDY